ncbi:protease SohB [Granulosicoccaceae sp. 1_MG-2023]|nr:protease SohB [Granulosicoccaceae sp. 1_MG-2023]
MAEFFMEYGLFLAKALTFVIAIGAIVVVIAGASQNARRQLQRGQVVLTNLNEEFEDLRDAVRCEVMSEADLKEERKAKKKQEKEKRKKEKAAAKRAARQRGDGQTVLAEPRKKRVYVMDFDGDIQASQVGDLRKEITAVLGMAEVEDEVLIRLESGGGTVTGYGLAASQLDRITQKKIPLTVCVDTVAASGGYMMACVANKILAAPFAVLGSIGVVAQIPNVHRLLKKHEIDVEILTAGEFKRTLTVFGQNTDKAREKFIEELEVVHQHFKGFIDQHRPQIDLATVATGETWSGQDALERKLIDGISTSDEYLLKASEEADVYLVKYESRKNVMERLGVSTQSALESALTRTLSRLWKARFFS